MKNTRIPLILLALLSLATWFRLSAQSQDPLGAYLDALDQQGFSGIVAVSKNGEPYITVDFGDANREKGTPWTKQTVSTTGSISKQFTAAAILKLEQEGKLSVNDPLTDYFDVPNEKDDITLHHLLTHSAGFPGAIGDDYKILSAEAFQNLAWKTPLLFKPGEMYNYSNVGYTLLAMIVEDISGLQYENYLIEELFKPAGMNQTGYLIPKWKTKKMAVGYQEGEKWGSNLERYEKDGEISWHLKGNGGVLSTAEDMLKWHQALQSGDILNQESLDKMYSPHVDEGNGRIFYGYGYTIREFLGRKLVKHNGGNQIFFADFLRFIEDDDLAIYLASNAWNPKFADIGMDIAGLLLEENYQPTDFQVKPTATYDKIPSNKQGNIVNGMLKVFDKNATDNELETYIRQHYAPGFIEQFGMDKHKGMLNRLKGDVEGREVTLVEAFGPLKYKVHLKKPGGTEVLVLEYLMENPSDPVLNGMGVDFYD